MVMSLLIVVWVTSVSIGHGYEPVAEAVSKEALGTNFQRPASIELDAAKIFLDTVQSGDMVKFAKMALLLQQLL